MKSLKLASDFARGILLLVFATRSIFGGTVDTSIKLDPAQVITSPVSACSDRLKVTLTIDASDKMAPGDQIVLQGPAGSEIDATSVSTTGDFVPVGNASLDATFTVSNPQITVQNPGTGGAKSGTIKFTIKLTGCALFQNAAANIEFSTLYTVGNGTVHNHQLDGTVDNQPLRIPVHIPAIGLTPSDFGLPHHSCQPSAEYFLMNDVVTRYYMIKAHSGKIDAFSLDITPQPGIEIQSIKAVGPDSAAPGLKLDLVTTPTALPIHLDFGGVAGISIAQCVSHASGSSPAYLDNFEATGDYILIEEKIKIKACTAPVGTVTDCANPSQKTLYIAGIHCDGNFATTPCYTFPFYLNINCVARATSFGFELSDRADGFHPNDFSQSGGISFCAGANGIDYTIYLENNTVANPGPASLGAGGAGAFLLKYIRLPINRNYFTFDELWINKLRIDNGDVDGVNGVNGYQNNVLHHCDNAGDGFIHYLIDFSKIDSQNFSVGQLAQLGDLSEPNMQLTDRITEGAVDHLVTGGSFNLLPEGKYIKIVCKNFRFTGQAKFKECAQPYSLADTAVLYGANMCAFNDSYPVSPDCLAPYTGVPWVLFENSPVRTRFVGYSYALSDTADIAPGNQSGKPSSANLTYTFLRTQSGFADNDDGPINLGQRVNWNLKVMKCPSPQYRAVIKLPVGFGISPGNGKTHDVKVSEPLNPSFTPIHAEAVQIGFGTETEWAVYYDGGPSLLDHNGGYITHPSQISLEFNLSLDCNLNGQLFGTATIPVQFQALCDTCVPEVYRTFSCAENEIFFHCPGGCSGTTVGTVDFDLKRITPGWNTEYDFSHDLNTPTVNTHVEPGYANRVYESDVVEATSTGSSINVSAVGTIAYEMAYDPPAAEHNLFDLIEGTFTFKLPDGTVEFSIPALSDASFLPADPPAHLKPMLRVYADVGVLRQVNGVTKTAQQWLHDHVGTYTVEFKADFRVKDDKPLTPDFYIIPQIRGQFIVVNENVLDSNQFPTEIDFSCDPWGDNLIFLKTAARITINQMVAPGGSFPFPAIDQCYLRYMLSTKVDGQFPVYDNFPGEYRPTLDYPNHIRFDIPAGYEYVSLGYAESESALGALTPIVNGLTDTTVASGGNGGYVEVNNLHGNYPDFRSIDTINRSFQALVLTLRRMCPGQNDAPIIVTDLDIITNAYCPEAAFHGNLMPAQPQTTPYTGADPYDIGLSTVDITVGNVNPVTIPVTLTHSGNNGAGTGLENTWVYFSVNPNSAPVTGLSVAGRTPDASGLYLLGELLNGSGATLNLNVEFECEEKVVGVPDDYKPVIIDIHYGNNCKADPVLQSPANGAPYVFTTGEEHFVEAPCLNKSHSITILPQPSRLSLTVDPPDTSCGRVVFHVRGSSPGADVQDAVFKVTPPAGFTLDTSASSVENVFMASAADLSPIGAAGPPDTWNVTGIPSILDHFNHLVHFNVDTPSPHNILDFTLVYVSTCSTPSGQYSFDFDLSGMSSCKIAKATALHGVIVNFVAEPVLVGAPDKTIRCGEALTFDLPTASGNCSPPPAINIYGADVSTQNSDPDSCGHYSYTVTRTWRATDSCGHVSLPCSQIITVQDTNAPDMVCGTIAAAYPTRQDAETAAIVATTATDGCGGPVTKTASTVGLCEATITVTATDVCGNHTNCVYTTTLSCNTNCCEGCTTNDYVSYAVHILPNTTYYLANTLCHPTNTLSAILPNAPNHTIVRKWNGVSLEASTRTAGAWSQNYSLNTGEGFVLTSTVEFDLIFSGCLPTNCPLPCLPPTNGCVLAGRLGIGTATWTNLSSCPPVCGTQVRKWNGTGFDNYDFVNDVWSPHEPQLAPGESAYVCLVENTNCCCKGCVTNGLGLYPSSYIVHVEHGNNFLANNLCHGAQNVLGAVLADQPPGTIPNGAVVYKWNGTGFNPHTFNATGGGWPDPNAPLKPGEGFVFNNPGPAFDLTFSGCEPTCPPPCGPTNGQYLLVGRIGSGAPTYYSNLFSCPPVCGTKMFVWDLSSYIEYDFFNHVWHDANGAATPEPQLGIGQSVFVTVGPNTNCCTIACASDKTVECGNEWHFDPPTPSVVCCTNVAVVLVSSNLVSATPCQNVFRGVWQITDCDAHISTCTQTVTQVDSTPPVITTCPTNRTLYADFQCKVYVPDMTGEIGATDVCSVVTVSQSPAAGTLFPGPGLHPVVFTVCDACTNCVKCTNQVRVICRGIVITKDTPWKFKWLTNGIPAPTNWHHPNYDDSPWQAGTPLFGSGATLSNYVWNFQTPIPAPIAGGAMTAYFRTHFWNVTTGAVTVRATNYVDDGAAFYLNGSEVRRLRLPPGPLSTGMVAFNQPNEGQPDVFSFSLAGLPVGDNVMAVEVHQSGEADGDVAFGMELLVSISPPTLQIDHSGGSVVISWASPGTLQSAENLAAPIIWTDVSGCSPYTTSPTNAMKFYRLEIVP